MQTPGDTVKAGETSRLTKKAIILYLLRTAVDPALQSPRGMERKHENDIRGLSGVQQMSRLWSRIFSRT